MKLTSLNKLIENYDKVGQSHVFKFFQDLSEPLKQEFLRRVKVIDLEEMSHLIENVMLGKIEETKILNLKPVDCISPKSLKKENYSKIIEIGEKALRSGKVGALLVAGGQGTRLGFHGPKGALPISPVKGKSFFQIFAEKIKLAQNSYEHYIPWYIMTSESNYEDTINFFDKNDNFGLKEIYFFKQGSIPSIDFKGKFLLDQHGLIGMSPDGHGGCFKALVQNNLISNMERRGVEIISYFQVDNPLVKCIDPLFIGLHIAFASEMSSKVVKKIDPEEQVGLFCKENKRLKVIEYSYAPKEMLTRRKLNGDLFFNAANIAVHLLERKFIKRMGSSNKLTFHQAKKSVSFLDEKKHMVFPHELNSIKFEKLIFDALGVAKNPILMEVSREEEFSPVKNMIGKDSSDSCKKDQLRQFARWFKAVNINIPSDENGIPKFNLEISPLFADTEETFIKKWNSLLHKPEIFPETYLE